MISPTLGSNDCAGCGGGPCKVRWQWDGGQFNNDPFGQAAKVVRAHIPVTTYAERESARTFKLETPSYPCASCGRFAFPKADTRCLWCRTVARRAGESGGQVQTVGASYDVPAPAIAAGPAVATPATAAAAGPSLAELRARANQRPHQCAAYQCYLVIPGHDLMCFDHAMLLPEWLREKLNAAYNPAAPTAWPLELVEDAIRFTMADSDLAHLVRQVGESDQRDLGLFALAGAR